jgi:hypothetical protein
MSIYLNPWRDTGQEVKKRDCPALIGMVGRYGNPGHCPHQSCLAQKLRRKQMFAIPARHFRLTHIRMKTSLVSKCFNRFDLLHIKERKIKSFSA